MSYAANLGRDGIVEMLHELGATDHAHALGRATLQTKIGTARRLHAMMGRPPVPEDALGGPTLLHMCVDYDEMEIARWLLDRGMDVDVKAAVDVDGFGGHTALFATVVSQPNFWMNYRGMPQVAPFTQLQLDRGANPNARVSLRKQLHPGYGEETMHEYRDVTPLSWGERFHRQIFVSKVAMEMIAARGGHG